MKNLVGKTVQMKLVGINGNAYSLMGAFQHEAQQQGWSKEEIKKVIDECTSGDYDHLLQTLIIHTTSPK